MTFYVQLGMVENLNQVDAMREADLDWQKDSVDCSYMSYVEFSKSMFELADMWVDSIDPRDYASFLRHMLNTISDTMDRGGFDSPVSWKDNSDISVRKAGGCTSDMQKFLNKQRELDGQRRRKFQGGEWDRPQMSHEEAMDTVNKGMSSVDKAQMSEVVVSHIIQQYRKSIAGRNVLFDSITSHMIFGTVLYCMT